MKFKDFYLNIGEKTARIYYHKFNNIDIKTFLIEFNEKVKVLSTLHGFKEVNFVGNNYNPPELWDFVGKNSEEYEKEIFKQLKINSENSAILFTGADMDNISIREERYENLRVVACVTAGVKTNAQRIGVDEAQSVEIGYKKFKNLSSGTVNIIVIPNVPLTDAAMARAIITITEAKTIAFEDLKIRSSYNKNLFATGTGTDNVIVVSKITKNENEKFSYVGGHAKLGEIIARCVTYAVKEAIAKSLIDYCYKNG